MTLIKASKNSKLIKTRLEKLQRQTETKLYTTKLSTKFNGQKFLNLKTWSEKFLWK